MTRKFLVWLACSVAVTAPAIAEEPARADGGAMLLTAAQMDRVTAGGVAQAFADALANVTADRILVTVSGEGENSAKSQASATMEFTYYPPSEDGSSRAPDRETAYEGKSEADSKIASVTSKVETPEPEVPVAPEPESPVVVYTPAQLLAQGTPLPAIIALMMEETGNR